MNYEDVADRILGFGINKFLDEVGNIIPNLHNYPEVWNEIPTVARPFITVRNVMGWLNKLKTIIPKIPKYEKYIMVVEMKRILSQLEDDYMRSVLHSEPDMNLAEVLQGLGEMHYDGV